MIKCEYCGLENQDGNSFCAGCNVQLPVPDQPMQEQPVPEQPMHEQPAQQPMHEQPAQQPTQKQPAQPNYQQPNYQQPNNFTQPQGTPNYQLPYGATQNTTGMMVWSIISIFLCLILGIIALVNVSNAKTALTQMEFDSKMNTAKTLNIISTALFGASLILNIIYVII